MEVSPNNASETAESRKRRRSGSASEDDSAESASSSDSSDDQPSRNKPVRKSRRTSHVSVEFEFLSQQVAFLTQLVTQSQQLPATVQTIGSSQDTVDKSKISDVVTNATDGLVLKPPESNVNKIQLNLSDSSTTVKDPLFPKSNSDHLDQLSKLQRFNAKDWYAIRFSEAQKKYATTPGFIELAINDELKRFESPTHEDNRLHLLERTFAALSNAILTQKDELRDNLQKLIDWAAEKDTVLSASSLFDKIEQVFNKQSNYMKATDDILQITCGRRADMINLRRESLLKQIPDVYSCDVLQNIPPSQEFLFNAEAFNTFLQKIGGAEKLMTSKPAPQPVTASHSSNYNFSRPSTSKQPNEKFFRHNNNSKKRKGNQNNQKTNTRDRPFNAKNRQNTKNKKPHSPSPSRNRGRRA